MKIVVRLEIPKREYLAIEKLAHAQGKTLEVWCETLLRKNARAAESSHAPRARVKR